MRRNALGYRVGQDHQKAKLTDAQVKDMRQLYQSWKAAGSRKGYSTLAEIFKCGESTARDIVTYRTRVGA